MKQMIYLDNAATTRHKPYSVYTAYLRYSLFNGGNAGRGLNALSLKGVDTLIQAQERVAELLGVKKPENIVFVPNATYGLNMAIMGVLDEKDNVVTTEMDHNSVLRPCALHGNFSVAHADKNGFVSPISLRRQIKSSTRLVVSTHVSNVCGTVEPVDEFVRTAHHKGALFLLDASQSAGSVKINMEELGADILVCPGHKGLMGPMGTGILCIKDPEKVKATIVGGTGSNSESLIQPETMPDKFHSGTMNLPAIAGLIRGVEFVLNEGTDAIGEKKHMLNSMLRHELMNMPNVTIYGEGATGITAFNIGDVPSDEVASQLGEDIIVRAGYHCAPLAHKALGTQDRGAVRISFGYFNTVRDVKTAVDRIYKVLRNYW